MSNGSSGGAIKAALEFIAGAIGSGGKTRKDLLASVYSRIWAARLAHFGRAKKGAGKRPRARRSRA